MEKTVYMISNSLGAMPRGVRDELNHYADTWASRGVRAWEEAWWMLPAEVGDQIGELMNAPKGSVSVHQNVTTCQAMVGSCFDFKGKRNKVVYSELNFPSVMYYWEAQRRYGARVHMVKSDDGITVPTERLLDAIDEETLIVPISHVVFRSSYIKDVPAIVEKAHKVGALVCLDMFHSLGTMPVDIQKLDVDFATGGVLKWLCGGPGTCYLYVKPELAKKLEPAFTGWTAHQNPFNFEVGPQKYTDMPYRFMTGTTNITALHAAVTPPANLAAVVGALNNVPVVGEPAEANPISGLFPQGTSADPVSAAMSSLNAALVPNGLGALAQGASVDAVQLSSTSDFAVGATPANPAAPTAVPAKLAATGGPTQALGLLGLLLLATVVALRWLRRPATH